MINITDYRLVHQGGFTFVRSNETSCCPVCGELLLMRSWRLRVMFNSTGERKELMIRRLYCAKCKRLHHELPDCIVPFKRHCAETIVKIINGDLKEVPCDDRTIIRILLWWKTANLICTRSVCMLRLSAC